MICRLVIFSANCFFPTADEVLQLVEEKHFTVTYIQGAAVNPQNGRMH
jgi:hypothetical protein